MNSILQHILMSIALIAAQLSTHPICCCDVHHDGVAETTYHVHADGHCHWHQSGMPPQSQSLPDHDPHECHCEHDDFQFVIERQNRSATDLVCVLKLLVEGEFVCLSKQESPIRYELCLTPGIDRSSARAARGVFLL